LEKRQLWSAVESKVIPTENVRAALAAVESGNVEAAIVYKTDAAISRKVKVTYEVPRTDVPDISYPMALVKDSRQREASRKFLQHLDSANALRVFEKFGFIIRK
jgi:molybdate transport system substrate-binding protein